MKRTQKRSLFPVLLTACAIGLLTGCGNSGIQEPVSAETSAAKPSATTNGQTNTDTNIPTDTDTKKQEDSAMTSNDTATPLPSASGTLEADGETAAFADTSAYPSLKDTYADYFRMGVCVNPVTVSKPEYSSLIVSQFNSMTNENNLKPEAIIDRAATLADVEANREHFVLDFSAVTGELDFAVANDLVVRGHTLIWHSQTPDFIFYEDYDPKGKLAGRELMLKRMENYMCDVFTWVDANYPDLFYAWDIANECIDDNGGLRDSLWRQTIGDDYLEYAFAYARKYAPDSIALFYNDYNASQSGKQADIIAALTPVAEAGNLDGIGMQGHIDTTLSPARFTFAAQKYAESLSVIIHVTELDVVSPTGGNPETLQGLYYGRLFQALIDARNSGVPIESVSIWGLTDSLSWKAGDKPLLFHDDLTPKTAFDEIIAAPF